MSSAGGRVVLVTGATGGIGRAIARRFAMEGAHLVLHCHSRLAEAQALRASLPGGDHVALAADLADGEAAERLFDDALRLAGRVDVLVNNAGVFEHHPLDGVDYGQWQAAWRRTLAINLTAPANLCYCAARHMRERGSGRIVNVSSRGAFRGEPLAAAYGASKAGLNALSQSLARALAPHGIFVHVVAPGFVDTEMAAGLLAGPEGERIRRQSPLGRVARPEEVAATVAFLASPEADYLTGGIVDINGASYLRS